MFQQAVLTFRDLIIFECYLPLVNDCQKHLSNIQKALRVFKECELAFCFLLFKMDCFCINPLVPDICTKEI